MARRAALGFEFVHAAALNLGRVFPRLLHLQPDRVAVAQAEEVGQARKLVRPAMNLDGLPSQGFGYPNYRGDDGGFAWQSFAL